MIKKDFKAHSIRSRLFVIFAKIHTALAPDPLRLQSALSFYVNFILWVLWHMLLFYLFETFIYVSDSAVVARTLKKEFKYQCS